MKTRNANVDRENTTKHENSSSSIQKKKSRKKMKGGPSQVVGQSGTYTGGAEEETPLGFFFEPSQFSKFPKIGSRCDPLKCVETIKKLGGNELRWFLRHPQFKHIFRMHQENNRKVMGAWSFIQRLAKTEKPQQLWFVVNGVPIRYGLREHGLLCGFHCHQYPENYKNLGGNRLVTKYFGKKAKPWVDHVYNKMSSMNPSEDRLKMTILWFLAIVIRGKTKVAGPIDPFLLSIVDDLPNCSAFPWGRLTFEDMVTEILRICDRMKGIVSPNTTIPGFILPIELLPFEAIPNLKKHFRENVSCQDQCPRMCKGRFKEMNTKGFEMGDIYTALGNSTEISSILEAKGKKRDLMEEIMGEEDDLKYDMIVDGWTTILANGRLILWTDILESDMAHRNHPTRAIAPIDCDVPPALDDQGDQVDQVGIRESIAELTKTMMEGFKTLNRRIDLLEKSKSGEPFSWRKSFTTRVVGDGRPGPLIL